ncbi:MAG: hypothetical protein JW731_12895 [Bacteroidales bacterium]|nr:hypothetical protein [Bacteroidales bacterium]
MKIQNKYKAIESKRYSRLLIILIIMAFNPAVSQTQELNFKEVDRETNKFYLQKNWDSLIILGKEAIREGVDYFYLRQRMGFAWFNKKNYRRSAQYFEKARQFNANDPVTAEYLYYCYLYSNRSGELKVLLSNEAGLLEKKLDIPKAKVFNHLYLETGYTFSDNFSANKGRRIKEGSSYYERDLNGDRYYLHLGSSLNVGSKLSLYIGYSGLIISKLHQILVPDNTSSSGNQRINSYDNPYNLYQHSVYANMNWALKNGLTLVPAVNILYVSSKNFRAEVIDFSGPVFDIIETDTSFFNYAASLALNKNFTMFNAGIFGSISNLNSIDQYQAGGEITYFPKGNLDVYTTSTGTWLNDDNKSHFIFEQLAGVKLSQRIWLEGFVALGEYINLTEKNVFVVHNSGDRTRFRAGLNFIMPIWEKVELSLRFQYHQMEGFEVWYMDDTNPLIGNFKYNNQTILGGLKWKF